MNLDEIREIVDFMKENGLSELEYSEKNTSIRLKLASPAPTQAAPAAEPEEAPVASEETADESDAIIPDEVKKAAAEAAAVTAAEVKKAAAKAAAAVSESIRIGATGVADYIKTKREEKSNTSCEVLLDEEEEPAPFIDDEPVEVFTENPDLEGDDGVKLDTASAKKAVKKTGEVLINTARAGLTLGKAGLLRGKTFITDRLKPKRTVNNDPEDVIPDENESEE